MKKKHEKEIRNIKDEHKSNIEILERGVLKLSKEK